MPTPKYMLGPWHSAETAQLRNTIDRARDMFDAKFLRKGKRNKDEADDGVDWDWVVKQMGCSRSRHQILCKAVELGLKCESRRTYRVVFNILIVAPWVRRGSRAKRRRVAEGTGL